MIYITLTDVWENPGFNKSNKGNAEFYKKYKNDVLLVECGDEGDIINFIGTAKDDSIRLRGGNGTWKSGYWYNILSPRDIVKLRLNGHR